MTYHGKDMTTVHPEGCVSMTWEDAEAMDKLNQENGWGFSDSDLLRLVADHIDAHHDETDGEDVFKAYKTMECIEWRLTDANFHSLVKMLSAHDYANAVRLIVASMDC